MIGIDAIEIERFKDFSNHPDKQLEKILTRSEIDYCMSEPIKSAERFAAHFAAKEACYKALSSAGAAQHSFMASAAHITLTRNEMTGAPILYIDWKFFELSERQALISLTHTKTVAIAMVMLA